MTGFATSLRNARVVAVIRHDDASEAERIADAAIAGGVTALEVTFTVPDAARVIRRLVARHPSLLVGAGTVLSPEHADAAADAGASFIVSPVLDEGLLDHARGLGLATVPGCFTPTEIARASRSADAVKIFPASALSPAFVQAVREVLPGVALLPTGGIATERVGDWLDAGATAVGLAGALRAAWTRGGADEVQKTIRTALDAAVVRSGA
jgi:2-dehydro-3-deoxyphosphogluconate aldolase / (4S)-4-hydroxy-2-oxoglutarate aldolase